VLDALRAEYGPKLRIAYKHFPLPFHRHAILAARGAVHAQRADKFWPYYDAVYARHGDLSVQVLLDIGKSLGFSRAAFRKALFDESFDRRILEDVRLGIELGLSGTPAYFVNGRPILGAQPPPAFILVIEEELARARALLDEGVDRSNLYDELIRRPLAPDDPPPEDPKGS